MRYKTAEKKYLVPYSADVYPAMINLTFMGGASAVAELEQCYSFPDSAFPTVARANRRPGHQGPSPREIPLPMVVYITMAVSIRCCVFLNCAKMHCQINFALNDLILAKPAPFLDGNMRSLYDGHLAAYHTFTPVAARSYGLQYLYKEAK